MNQRLILLMLRRLGHRADLVSNGVEATAAVARRRYDVVLMDVRMPELDGPAATRLIHARLGDQRPWIVAVTAEARPGERAACLAAGMDDHVTKPLTAAELAGALERARAAPRRTSADLPPGSLDDDRAAPVLDPMALDGLRELVGSDPAALSGLVAEFLAETPPLVGALRTAVAAGDPEGAQRAAHTLRGLGATFGATAMARLCRRAESHLADLGDDPPAAMAPVVAAIADEHERVTRALRRLA